MRNIPASGKTSLSFRVLFIVLILAFALTLAFAVHHHLLLTRQTDYSLALLGAGIYFTGRHPAGANDNDTMLAPLVAIVGCDGSGKSTLAADMQATLGTQRRVATCYLGLGSGTLGERIKQVPLIGRPVERHLAGKAKRTRTKTDRIPGLATALVVYGFSLLRRRRFRQMLALRRQGVMVITDRYPQTEVPGFYDGPGLSAARAGSRLVALLATSERRIYERMAGYRPDVVIRLNVDVATAHARKPDHQPDLLARKVAVTPSLRFGGARIVDLDATSPYAEVRASVLRIIGDATGCAVPEAQVLRRAA